MTALAPAPETFPNEVGQPHNGFVDWLLANRQDITHFDELNSDDNEQATPCDELPAGTKKIVIYYTVVNGLETIDEIPYIVQC